MRFPVLFLSLSLILAAFRAEAQAPSAVKSTIEGVTLTGEAVHIPAAQDQVTLLVMTAEPGAREAVRSWLLPFYRRFSDFPEVTCYEVPTQGVPSQANHSPDWQHHVLTTNSQALAPLLPAPSASCQIILIDGHGTVRYRAVGSASSARLAALYQATVEAL